MFIFYKFSRSIWKLSSIWLNMYQNKCKIRLQREQTFQKINLYVMTSVSKPLTFILSGRILFQKIQARMRSSEPTMAPLLYTVGPRSSGQQRNLYWPYLRSYIKSLFFPIALQYFDLLYLSKSSKSITEPLDRMYCHLDLASQYVLLPLW